MSASPSAPGPPTHGPDAGPVAHQGSGTIGAFAFRPRTGSVLDEDIQALSEPTSWGLQMAFIHLLMKFKTFNRMFA